MPATVTTASSGFSVSNWKPFEKNTPRGFLSLTTPSGMVIHGVTLHQKGDSRWLGMPSRSFEKDGTTTWTSVVEFASKAARDKFQAEALAAVDRFLGGGQ
jgi:hypothetical protein